MRWGLTGKGEGCFAKQAESCKGWRRHNERIWRDRAHSRTHARIPGHLRDATSAGAGAAARALHAGGCGGVRPAAGGRGSLAAKPGRRPRTHRRVLDAGSRRGAQRGDWRGLPRTVRKERGPQGDMLSVRMRVRCTVRWRVSMYARAGAACRHLAGHGAVGCGQRGQVDRAQQSHRQGLRSSIRGLRGPCLRRCAPRADIHAIFVAKPTA